MSIFDPPEYSSVLWFEDGVWMAICPELPGCMSYGHTRAQAWANLRAARQEMIEALTALNLDVAPPQGGYTVTIESPGLIPTWPERRERA